MNETVRLLTVLINLEAYRISDNKKKLKTVPIGSLQYKVRTGWIDQAKHNINSAQKIINELEGK